MNNKKFVKILSFVLAALLVITFIVPAFSMIAFAATTDNSQEAFITDFKIDDNGLLGPTIGKTVTVSVMDNRVKFDDEAKPATDSNVSISMLPCSFTTGSNSVKVNSSKDGLNYTITFDDVKYNGGEAQDFSFTATYTDENNQSIPVELKTFTQTVSQVDKNPIAPISNENFMIDASKEVFVQNYVIMDMSGNELSTVKPGQKVKIAVGIVDNRISYLYNAPAQIRARLAQGSFINNDINNISYKLRDVGKTADGRSILGYSIVFHDVTYNGGSSEIAFDVSYIENIGGQETPLAVPQSTLKVEVTQAIDDVPEPKVILNSANYGGVAYVGKNFTLGTVATNTSQYVPLENVSVKVELPAGIAMASGNSQALIGQVEKGGKISHSFDLVVTGVDNNVSSLPVKVIYEFEAYVKGERKAYTTSQDVAINIQQETKFDISKLEYMETITAEEESVISVYLINKGKTSVNNVTAEIQCDAVNGPQTVFVGNVEPGSENTADIYFTVMEPGTVTGKVIITYEDSKGVQNKIEKDFTTEAMEPMNNGFDEPVMEPEVEQKGGFPWAVVVVGVLLVGAGVGFVVYKKQKAKKMTEDEDEDI